MENFQIIIEKAYTKYVLTHGKRPASVYIFMEEIGQPEGLFYQYYNSFSALESGIWASIFEQAKSQLLGQTEYQQYSIREKMLGFLFTLMETLKNNRSFVQFTLRQTKPDFSNFGAFGQRNSFMGMNCVGKPAEELVKQLMQEWVAEGIDSQEIAARQYLTDRYPDIFWLQTRWLIEFWLNDHSKDFEKTDAAVEKSVNLFFDFITPNALDSTFDFAKFMFQQK